MSFRNRSQSKCERDEEREGGSKEKKDRIKREEREDQKGEKLGIERRWNNVSFLLE